VIKAFLVFFLTVIIGLLGTLLGGFIGIIVSIATVGAFIVYAIENRHN